MKPAWLKIKLPNNHEYAQVEQKLVQARVNTVCIEAKCPNRIECWSRKAMTFMILGSVCTRKCRFCSVQTGKPGRVDYHEGEKIAQIVKELGINDVVLTSVTRDDLTDGGASVFAETIKTVKKINPKVKIEVLVPDFLGRELSVQTVIDGGCDVFSHNIETTERLTEIVRDPQANYQTSLYVLQTARQYKSDLLVKSGLMVGLGEIDDEVKQTISDLFNAGARILTIGQYLQPTPQSIVVTKYITPAVFESYKEYALSVGFKYVFSGPFVRSSYARLHRNLTQ